VLEWATSSVVSPSTARTAAQKSTRPKIQLHIRDHSFDFAFGEIIRVKQIRDSNDVKPKSGIGLVDFAKYVTI
jgi:hypothetical protein